MTTARLFVGVTSWNSSAFLDISLSALRASMGPEPFDLVVWDNGSADDSARIAARHGATVVVQPASQSDALNRLFRLAARDWVLLMHADVVLLERGWLDRFSARARAESAALISPEDVGCGPFTRPFGKGMPESSFLFFERVSARKCAEVLWRVPSALGRFARRLDLYGPHVTHRLPAQLARRGVRWSPLNVQTSDVVDSRLYGPYPDAEVWTEELATLRYGLGNFYGFDGIVSHYHNWYDRFAGVGAGDRAPISRSFPREFIHAYSRRFLEDYRSGHLVVPPFRPRDREPKTL